MSSRTHASPTPPAYYQRIIKAMFWEPGYGATYQVTANRVYLTPLEVQFTATIDEIIALSTTGGVGHNLRAGLYRAVGLSPVGGALVTESGSIVTANDTLIELPVTNVRLTPGLYFLALQSDADPWLSTLYIAIGQNPTYPTAYYDGVYGPYASPCPAVNALAAGHFCAFLRILTIP